MELSLFCDINSFFNLGKLDRAGRFCLVGTEMEKLIAKSWATADVKITSSRIK